MGRQKNINRLVWNNSFSNDKRLHANKEPYKKQCKNCGKSVWMMPDKKGWKAVNQDGKQHQCKNPKKLKESKSYIKDCRNCGKPIRMILKKKKWLPRDTDGGHHRCEQWQTKITDILNEQ